MKQRRYKPKGQTGMKNIERLASGAGWIPSTHGEDLSAVKRNTAHFGLLAEVAVAKLDCFVEVGTTVLQQLIDAVNQAWSDMEVCYMNSL